jgi:hypothetical protein
MAISNSTTLNDLVGQIVSDTTQSAAYSARVMRNLVSVKEVPLGAGSIVMPRFQALTEGALTEGTATTSTTWSTDGVTLTPVERGIYVQISKRALHADPFSDLSPYGEQLGRALGQGEDKEILAVMGSGVFATTVNAGATLTAANYRTAIATLEAANAPKPYFCVLAPQQWADIVDDFGDAATFAGVGTKIVEGFGEGYPSMNGYVGAPYGVPTFITTQVQTDASRYHGAMFSKEAVGFAYIKDIGVDVDDNITARAFDVMAWRSADQKLLVSTYGVGIARNV